MKAVTLTSNYRLTIPADIRKRYGLKPGHKVEFRDINGSVYFIPLNGTKASRRLART